MFVAAFDIASTTGAAHGDVGDPKPRLWAWVLSDGGEERHQRLAYFDRYLSAYFAEYAPDVVAYEKPLGIAVIASMMAKGLYRTSEDVLLMLRGAIGVLEARASAANVPKILPIDIKAARGHLVGQRTFPKGQDAKAATMRAAASLGWDPQDDNEADAAAIWSLVCAQENPKLAAALGRAHLASKDMSIGRKAKEPGAGPLFAQPKGGA